MQRRLANKQQQQRKSNNNSLTVGDAATAASRFRPFTGSLSNRQKDLQPPPRPRKTKKCKDETPFLTEALVGRAILSLHHDGIRPLLPDLVQRIKFLTKSIQGAIDRKAMKLDVGLLYSFLQTQCSKTIRLIPYAHRSNDANNHKEEEILSSSKEFQPSSFLLADGSFIEAALINKHKNQPDIVKPATDFIDPHSCINSYAEIIWRSLYSFLLSRLSNRQVTASRDFIPYQFKGGRYGLAAELQKSGYPSLEALRLAELCNLVQLAIEGGLLAYENSSLKPIAACRELCELRLLEEIEQGNSQLESGGRVCDKEASLVQPAQFGYQLQAQQRSRVFTTVEDLVECLEMLLQDRPGGIVLAQLRKKLLAKFHRELIPERLGYRKLTDCLMSQSIQAVAQIVSICPNSHRLVLMHRRFTADPPAVTVTPMPHEKVADAGSLLERNKNAKNRDRFSTHLHVPFSSDLPLLKSPGSLSTAAPSEDNRSSASSSFSKTPDLTNIVPMKQSRQLAEQPLQTHQSYHLPQLDIQPPIPFAVMSRSPSGLTPISFLFLARSKQARHMAAQFTFSPVSADFYDHNTHDVQSSDDGNDTPFYVVRVALQEMQDLLSSTNQAPHKNNTYEQTQQQSLLDSEDASVVYWDCLLQYS